MSKQDALRDLLARLDAHVPGEGDHGERVAVYSAATGAALGCSEADLERLRFAGALHDIGKLGLRPDLITKTGQLEGQEVIELRKHTNLASRYLQDTPFPDLAPDIEAHHERFDGLGYPNGIAGEAIPLVARIIAVAETFDALTRDARWRAPLNEDQALTEIRRCSGTQFDPAVIAPFLEVQRLIQPL